MIRISKKKITPRIHLVIDYKTEESQSELFNPSLIMSLITLFNKSSFPRLIHKIFMVNLSEKQLKISRSYIRSIFPRKLDFEIFCLGKGLNGGSELAEKVTLDLLFKHV